MEKIIKNLKKLIKNNFLIDVRFVSSGARIW